MAINVNDLSNRLAAIGAGVGIATGYMLVVQGKKLFCETVEDIERMVFELEQDEQEMQDGRLS